MKIIFTFFVLVLFFINSGCQTIENKSQAAIKKEKWDDIIEAFKEE